MYTQGLACGLRHGAMRCVRQFVCVCVCVCVCVYRCIRITTHTPISQQLERDRGALCLDMMRLIHPHCQTHAHRPCEPTRRLHYSSRRCVVVCACAGVGWCLCLCLRLCVHAHTTTIHHRRERGRVCVYTQRRRHRPTQEESIIRKS